MKNRRVTVYRDRAAVEYFAQPTRHQVHIDTAMTNISIAYRNEVYIAEQIFPNVPVKHQSDKYFVFDKASWFRDEAGPRPPGGRAPRVEYALTTGGPYACIEYAAAKGIPDEIVDNADNPLNPDREGTEFVTDKLLMRKEKDISDLVFTGANWTNTGTPAGGVWSGDTSDPINDITGSSGIRETVRKAIGRYPNTMVMGATVWAALQRHPDFLDRVKYTQLGIVTEDLAAKLFQVNKLLIGTAIINNAQEGAADDFADIWGASVFLGWTSPSPSLMSPSAGYVFTWKPRQVNRYREEQEHQDIVEALENWDAAVTSKDSGYLLTSVV